MLKPISHKALNGYFAAGVSFAIFAPVWQNNRNEALPKVGFFLLLQQLGLHFYSTATYSLVKLESQASTRLANQIKGEG
jgi:predicted Kef-type K+ transport protein